MLRIICFRNRSSRLDLKQKLQCIQGSSIESIPVNHDLLADIQKKNDVRISLYFIVQSIFRLLRRLEYSKIEPHPRNQQQTLGLLYQRQPERLDRMVVGSFGWNHWNRSQTLEPIHYEGVRARKSSFTYSPQCDRGIFRGVV